MPVDGQSSDGDHGISMVVRYHSMAREQMEISWGQRIEEILAKDKAERERQPEESEGSKDRGLEGTRDRWGHQKMTK